LGKRQECRNNIQFASSCDDFRQSFTRQKAEGCKKRKKFQFFGKKSYLCAKIEFLTLFFIINNQKILL